MSRRLEYLTKNRIIFRRDPITDVPTERYDWGDYYENGTYECYSLFQSKAKINSNKSFAWHIMVLIYLNHQLSLNDRGFEAFTYNPFSGYTHDFKEVKIINVFQEVKWFFPKLKNGHILTAPLTAGDKPNCVYFAKELNQIPDVIQVGDLI